MVCVAGVPLWSVSGVCGSVRLPCNRALANEELRHEGYKYQASGAHLVGKRTWLRGIEPEWRLAVGTSGLGSEEHARQMPLGNQGRKQPNMTLAAGRCADIVARAQARVGQPKQVMKIVESPSTKCHIP